MSALPSHEGKRKNLVISVFSLCYYRVVFLWVLGLAAIEMHIMQQLIIHYNTELKIVDKSQSICSFRSWSLIQIDTS